MNDCNFNGYTIRKIRAEDNTAIAHIIRYNLKERGLDIPGTAYFDPFLDVFSTYYEGKDDADYFVLTDSNGRVVGGIGFEKTDIVPESAELQKIYLDDSVKGQGLGYALIEFIEDRMREAGVKSSYLETHTNLDVAIHLYEKTGYRRIDRPANVGHSTMDHFYIKELYGND